MSTATPTGALEWRAYWTLPLAAALGYSVSVLHIYSLGPFIEPLQQEFGWSRAQVSLGITIANVGSALLCIPVGILVDRFGPRRIGLAGVILMSLAYALLGTTTGLIANWILLWAAIAVCAPWAQSTIWTSAVASRFEVSRGLAFAVTLSGAPLGATVFPVLAAWLIGLYDWRIAFAGTGAIWAAFVLPIIFLAFRGARDGGNHRGEAKTAEPRYLPGLSLQQGLASVAFYKLVFAGGLFAFTIIGILVHFIPILTATGTGRLAAAGIASLIGIFSFLGRLFTGLLLDRLQGHHVGAAVFLLANIACLLLLFQGESSASQVTAAIIIGLTLGAEVDVMAYLSSRHFGLNSFGALFGGVVAALTLGAAFGPLAAGATFDRYESYAPFLVITMILVTLSSLALVSLGRPRFTWNE